MRDDPQARLALARRSYLGPTGNAPRHLPFRGAEVAFMRWQLRRGVLAPHAAAEPGSPWWRACNERLLRDGYLAHEDLAADENEAERFFLNVTLVRVLYAHALVAAPRLALGRLAPVAAPLGDSRVRMTALFLSLSRVLPEEYPLVGDVAFYLARENRLARLLDYGVITPRLQGIYDWSADVLQEPRLRTLVDRGCPHYAWEPIREVWQPDRPGRAVRGVRSLLPLRQ